MFEKQSLEQPSQTAFTYETLLYSAAVLTAAFMRLFRLGAAALTDQEAQWALQALEIVRSAGSPALNQVQIGAQPLNVIFTSLIFFLFKQTNATARLLPAICGILLVCLPWVLRPILSGSPILRRGAVLLAFALAVDPALVLLSRTAGSSMPAISLGLLAAGLWLVGRRTAGPYLRLAVVFGALALLSGPGLIAGGLGLGLAALAWVVSRGFRLAVEDQTVEEPNHFTRQDWLVGAVILLAAGTGMLILPQGAAGLSSILPEYFKNWFLPSGVPALRLPAAVFLYQPAAFIFGLVGTLRVWVFFPDQVYTQETALGRFFSVWALAAALLAMLQPGRQVSEMTWALIPLWGLACLELAHYQPGGLSAPMRRIAALAALALSVFLVMGVYYGLYLTNVTADGWQTTLLLAGILAMTAIVVVLVGIGWSFETASLSLVWSMSTILLIWMLSSTWSQSFLQPNHPSELWSSGSTPAQSRELLASLQQLSEMKTGQPSMLDIVLTTPSPSLRWLLRDYSNLTIQNDLRPNQLPAAIITDAAVESPALMASYTGQDFDWQMLPGWNTSVPPDLRIWIYTHRAPILSEQIILWVRGDVFPGGTLQPVDTAPAATP